MKKIYFPALTGLIILAAMTFGPSMTAQGVMNSDSVTMGQYYASEVYYSMKNGMVSSSARNSWDIAFRTKIRSSSIITNDGSGVVLWSYPKSDSSGWASVDTSGLYSWTRMFNDVNDWENGAFSRNAKGHPDYGWGVYNDQTHDVAGDSIFIIKLRDGSFRKLRIILKNSVNNVYYFMVAGLDGSGVTHLNINCNDYLTKDFIGYSLETSSVVDYQAAKADWDLLFTKYMSIQPNGTPYAVTGVLNNDGIKTKTFHPVPLNYTDFGPGAWDSTRSSIGWEWKYIDTNYVYHITDSSVYFIRTLAGDIFKLYFTKFAGSSTGLIAFKAGMTQGQGIKENSEPFALKIYPNPVSDRVSIAAQGSSFASAVVDICDLSGRSVRKQMQLNTSGTVSADVSGLNAGIYLIRVTTSSGTVCRKMIISR
jgi:hypothetical protein